MTDTRRSGLLGRSAGRAGCLVLVVAAAAVLGLLHLLGGLGTLDGGGANSAGGSTHAVDVTEQGAEQVRVRLAAATADGPLDDRDVTDAAQPFRVLSQARSGGGVQAVVIVVQGEVRQCYAYDVSATGAVTMHAQPACAPLRPGTDTSPDTGAGPDPATGTAPVSPR